MLNTNRESFKENIKIDYLIYFALLLVTGSFISHLNNNNSQFNNFGSLVWFITFMILTLSFSPIRKLISPLLNFKPMRKPTAYFYIFATLAITFLLLKVCVKYEILIDHNLIVFYKNGLLEGRDLFGVMDAILFVPIWEEMFFRGILLLTLAKLLNPFWAIAISSVIFAMFHPLYLITALISGLLMALITFKTKSLLPSVITHSIWNLYSTKLFLYF